jgi:uncharacterized protein YjbJ (UPF0337 family)
MKAFPWIIAGAGIGIAASYILFNQPPPQDATGYDSVEDAADRTARWGSKQRLSGVGRNVAGKVKEGFGRATGNDDLAGEGVVDQVAGTFKDAAGQLGNAVGETIHDLNR